MLRLYGWGGWRFNASNGSGGYTSPADGAQSTLTYSGGLLSTIQSVNSRTTTLVYSGTDLTQITNPDGGTHTFS